MLLNLIGAYLGILLTFFYNGKKGKVSKVLQYGIYWFYPVHLLLLGGIGFLIA
ncbi:TraX protein [compost metagenome]